MLEFLTFAISLVIFAWVAILVGDGTIAVYEHDQGGGPNTVNGVYFNSIQLTKIATRYTAAVIALVAGIMTMISAFSAQEGAALMSLIN